MSFHQLLRHSLAFVHLDIKPDNILVARSDEGPLVIGQSHGSAPLLTGKLRNIKENQGNYIIYILGNVHPFSSIFHMSSVRLAEDSPVGTIGVAPVFRAMGVGRLLQDRRFGFSSGRHGFWSSENWIPMDSCRVLFGLRSGN